MLPVECTKYSKVGNVHHQLGKKEEEEEKNDAKKTFNSRRNASGVSTITSFLLTIKNSARFLQRSQIVSRYVKNVLLLFLA